MHWNRSGAWMALFAVLGLAGFGLVSSSWGQGTISDANWRTAGCAPQDAGCLYYPPFAKEFDAAYLASLRPVVRNAMQLDTEQERLDVLRGLADVGALIDEQIMVGRQSPFWTMYARWTGGYRWVPSALQPPIPVVPGVTYPGLPSYDPDHAPADSIAVINPLDRSQWPEAFDKPEPAPAPDSHLVGPKNGGVWLSTAAGRAIEAGKQIVEDGKTCVKQVTVGLFGAQHFWMCTVNG